MATYGTYYFNGPTLAQATAVFTDAGLTTLAADGWYSDGVTTRQQVGGVLGVELVCPSCTLPCSTLVANTATHAVAPAGPNYMGKYLTTSDVGEETGAVIVRVFLKNEAPTGLRAIFGEETGTGIVGVGGDWSNKFTASDGGGANGGYRGDINGTPLVNNGIPLWVGSATTTFQQTPPPGACAGAATLPFLPNNPPFTGSTGGTATIDIPNNTGVALPIYSWDNDNENYVNTTSLDTINVQQQQVQLGAGSGNWLMAVLPKLEGQIQTVALEMQQLYCPVGGTAYIQIECAVQLTGFNASFPQATVPLVCEASIENDFFIYNAPGAQGETNGQPTTIYDSGKPNLYDFVFKDPNGEVYADEGYYKYIDTSINEERYFEVDDHGVVIQTGLDCQDFLPSVACDTGIFLDDEVSGPGTYKVNFATGATTGAVIVRFFPGAIPEGIYVTHTTGGSNVYYNNFSAAGSSNDATGYANQSAYLSDSLLGSGSRNISAGGEPLPYPATTATPVWIGRVVKDEYIASGAGFCVYPNATSSGGGNPSSNQCPGQEVFGKANLPSNGIHDVNTDEYEYIAESLINSSNFQTMFEFLNPEINGGPDANGNFVYPTDTTGATPTSQLNSGLFSRFNFTQDNAGNFFWDEVPPSPDNPSLGNSGYITVNPNQVQLSLNHPGMCMTVIPKTVASDENMELTVQSIFCNSGFWFWFECVSPLNTSSSGGTITVTGFDTSGSATSATACASGSAGTFLYCSWSNSNES